MEFSSGPTPDTRRIALPVMVVDGEMLLCPFFGKCDGVLIVEPGSGRCSYHAKPRQTDARICDLILDTGVDRLIVGFVPGPAAQKLRAAGVDIRLGSCACAVEDLAACFDRLPAA